MLPLLNDLVDYVARLPVGTVLDDALKTDLLARLQRVGQGAPQASHGSGFADLTEELVGDEGRYPAPAGPAGPPPPPPPPVSPGPVVGQEDDE